MQIPEIKLIERNGYIFQIDVNNPNRRFIEPTTVALILGGTGLGIGMKGQYQAGRATQAQAKSEAAWQEYNAKLAEREAEEKLTAVGQEEKKFRKSAERKKARMRTQAGQAGLLPVGSIEDVAIETATELEADALMIRRGGQVGAQFLTAQAQLSRLSGRSALLRGKAAKRAGVLGAFGTGLSGASALTFKALET